MSSRKARIGLATLVAAFLVEELWSLAAMGQHAGSAGSQWGLISAVPSPVIAVSLGLGLAALMLSPGRFTGRGERHLGARQFVGVAIVLAHIYFSHELLQVALGDGHAVGIHGLFDHGGWIFFPIAGLLVTTVLAVFSATMSLRKYLHFAVDVFVFRLAEVATRLFRSIQLPFDSVFFANRTGRAPPSILA